MFHIPLIRRMLAGTMLVLFAFSIAPKKILHDLVANHQDTRKKSILTANPKAELAKAGINCQYESLVVEVPFITAHTSFDFSVKPSVFVHEVQPVYCFYPSDHICFGLRGPPARCL